MTFLTKLGDLLLGTNLEARDLHFYQLVLRGLITFFALLLMIRFAGRRFLANRNPLDVLLTFLLASMLARAVNGNTPFFGTLGTGFFLAAAYRLMVIFASRFHAFGRFLKGEPEPVIENGHIRQKVLDRHHVSHHDLMEDLRLNGKINDVAGVKLAQLERNGAISVVRKD